jgi:hypothetical protein
MFLYNWGEQMNYDRQSHSKNTGQNSRLGVKLLMLACFVMFIGIPSFTGKGFLPSFISMFSNVGAQQATAEDLSDGMAAKLQTKYLAALDEWVRLGGNVNTIQKDVVQTCGKLALTYGTAAENAALLTDTEELSFRADVCAKMTINRVHPQPEFEDAKIISSICDGQQKFYIALCKRIGLR